MENKTSIKPFSKKLASEISVVGSKSITNRALLLAAISGNTMNI